MDIRKSLPLALATALVLAMLAVRVGYTQEGQPAAEAAEQSEKPKQTRRAPRGRLPNHYGKLGLSEEQRTKIYGIQQNYRTQVQDLQRQIEDLRQQETLEIQETLSEKQRTQLVAFLKEAQKRREARRKARQARTRSETE